MYIKYKNIFNVLKCISVNSRSHSIYWNDAATLMLVKKSELLANDFNYSVLLLKRSSGSKFMPSTYVFPGGKSDLDDFSSKWSNIFPHDLLSSLCPSVKLYEGDAESHNSIPKSIGFKLTAIRETFEESGVCLLSPHPDKSDFKISLETLEYWRTNLNNNVFSLREMTESLKIKPAVGDLYEWSNWLTPTNMPKKHGIQRFDTIFYISFIDQPIECTFDNHEVVSSEWLSPPEALQAHKSKSILLPPPQVYELSKLCNISSFDELKEYAQMRVKYPINQIFPVRIMAEDGVMTVLPGDALYPETPDYFKPANLAISETLFESSEKCRYLHRVELKELHTIDIKCNLNMSDMNLNPQIGFEKAFL